MYIEQAVFTSAQSDRASGYHLVSRSPGITDADARELAAWGPSHDSLLDPEAWAPGSEVCSENYFPLKSGHICVSRTTAAGAEYSRRGGMQVYTQCLVLSAEAFVRFANNPFAVLRAATAAGAMCVLEQAPTALEPIELGGRTPAVDRALLAQANTALGAAAIAQLVAQTLRGESLVISRGCAHLAIAALFNCLPVAARIPFSFTTGLKHSACRPFRLLCMGEDHASASLLVRNQGMHSLDLRAVRNSDSPLPITGWAGFVAAALTSGKLSKLTSEIGNQHGPLALSDLDARGDALLVQLSDVPSKPACSSSGASASAPTSAANLQRADAAHDKFAVQRTVSAVVASDCVESIATASRCLRDAKSLSAQTPEVIEMLEHLDDVVFAAIAGQPEALEQVEVVWSLVLDELGPELVEESREQYLRYALKVWNQCLAGELPDPHRAVAAVDVMCLLFGH